jgi:hypothetical protein
MATEGKEVAIHRLNVYLKVGCTLGAIYQNGDAVLVGYLDNLFYGINCT